MAKIFNIFKWIRDKKKESSQPNRNTTTIEITDDKDSCSIQSLNLTSDEYQLIGSENETVAIEDKFIQHTDSIEYKMETTTTEYDASNIEEDIFERYKQYNNDAKNDLIIKLTEQYENLLSEFKTYRIHSIDRELRLKQTIELLESEKSDYEERIHILGVEKSDLEKRLVETTFRVNFLENRENEVFKEHRMAQRRYKSFEKKYQQQISECLENFEKSQRQLLKQNENLLNLLINSNILQLDNSLGIIVPNDNNITKHTETIRSTSNIKNKTDNETERDYRSHLDPKHIHNDVRLKIQHLRRMQNSITEYINGASKPMVFYSLKTTQPTNNTPQNIPNNSMTMPIHTNMLKYNDVKMKTIGSCKKHNYIHHCSGNKYLNQSNNPKSPHRYNSNYHQDNKIETLLPNKSSCCDLNDEKHIIGDEIVKQPINNEIALETTNHKDNSFIATRKVSLSNNINMMESSFVIQSGVTKESYCVPEAPYYNIHPSNTVSILNGLNDDFKSS